MPESSFLIVDVVGGSCGPIDFDVVVVSPQQPFSVQIECLLTDVGRDGPLFSDSTAGLTRTNGIFRQVHIANPTKYASCKSPRGHPVH